MTTTPTTDLECPIPEAGQQVTLSATQRCEDPSCPGTGELERDGLVIYFECDTCGYTFGWHRLSGRTFGAPIGTNPEGHPKETP